LSNPVPDLEISFYSLDYSFVFFFSVLKFFWYLQFWEYFLWCWGLNTKSCTYCANTTFPVQYLQFWLFESHKSGFQSPGSMKEYTRADTWGARKGVERELINFQKKNHPGEVGSASVKHYQLVWPPFLHLVHKPLGKLWPRPSGCDHASSRELHRPTSSRGFTQWRACAVATSKA
jgi:hypothetical protein